MFLNVNRHVSSRIANITVEQYPFPHFIVDNIFPEKFYNQLLINKIPTDCLENIKDLKRVGAGYSDSRYAITMGSKMSILEKNIRYFWQDFAVWMKLYLKGMLLTKFGIPNATVGNDVLYVRDYKNYKLGPHTDKKKKVLTCLIYLPSDNSSAHMGTSMYLPKNPEFTCEGGPHHKYENFDLYKTVTYEPNKMFCFLKTDKSFHGVEPIVSDVERNLVIFDMQAIES